MKKKCFSEIFFVMASKIYAKNITTIPTTTIPTTTTPTIKTRNFSQFEECMELVPESKTNRVPESKPKQFRNPTSNLSKFVVDFSIIEKRKQEQYNEKMKEYNNIAKENLAKLGNVREFSMDGKFTRICNAIQWQGDGDEKKKGVCTREWCTFAHSKEELKDKLCRWDERCNFYQVGGNRECIHRHSCESRQEFFQRTGKSFPDYLPDTNKESRKPTKNHPTTYTTSTIDQNHSKKIQQMKEMIRNLEETKRPKAPTPINITVTPTPFHSPKTKTNSPKTTGISKLQPIIQNKPITSEKEDFEIITEQVVVTTVEKIMSVVEMMKKKGITKYTIKIIE
jgi:hypothetical protein